MIERCTKRAALSQSLGDPFILIFWLSFYEKVWKDEVDKLYIDLNMPSWVPEEVKDFNRKIASGTSKSVVIEEDDFQWHGMAMKRLAEACKEELVVFIEDDCVIFKRGQLDKCFKLIEADKTDLVGSPRDMCSKIICERSAQKYGFGGHPLYNAAPNWWPNLFFIHRSDLLRTDMHFWHKNWSPGEKIEPLDLTAKEDICGDTFVWTSIQLRALGLRDIAVPQYRSYPHDLQLQARREGLWDGDCGWVHIGNLSNTSATYCLFADSAIFVPCLKQLDMIVKKSKGYYVEYQRVLSWLRFIIESAVQLKNTESIRHIRQRYEENLDNCISTFQMDVGYINRLIKTYQTLLAQENL